MMTINEVRLWTKIILVLMAPTLLNTGAMAIVDPSLSTIGRFSETVSTITLLALWLNTTKGYALFAKTHGEL